MAKQTFTAGQVLTAAQMNTLQANDYNLTVSTKTDDYTFVAGDKGTRVVANKASAIEFTVDDAIFTAGDTLQVSNINTGLLTLTAGSGVTLNGADVLTVAQWQGGTLYFTSASSAIWFPTAKTVADSGLTLVKSQTIGSAVSSVTVTDAFSSTYDAYKITLSGGTGSTNDELLGMTLGATTTGYYASYSGTTYSTNNASLISNNNAASWTRAGTIFTDGLFMNVDLVGPNLAKRTFITGGMVSEGQARPFSGYLANTTAYTAFTLTVSSGNISGGTIRVYGYKN